MTVRVRFSLVPVALAATAVAIALPRFLRPAEAAPAATAAPIAADGCDPDNAGLTLPPGFCAGVFAEGLGAPRHGVVAPTGELLVNVRPGRGTAAGKGAVYLLRDTNGDGKADETRRLADVGGTGIALANGALYATAGDAIVRWRLKPGTVEPAAGPDTIVRDLPMGGHSAHNFVVDGPSLHVNIGSRSNSCQVQDRANASPGVDPCTELDTRAGIWTYSATKTGQRATDGVRFATGIRNAVALTLRGPGDVWAVQHGRDQLAQNWGRTEQESAENPAEELFHVMKGDDFGWPYCYWSHAVGKKVLAPEYGGDGTQVGRCAQKKDPVYPFPGHWAPNAVHFYTGAMFPASYRAGVFVAFHGSWNRAPLPQQGFNVTFLPMAGDKASGTHQVFADGFIRLNERGQMVGGARPTGLAQGADGALFVMDDAGGKVFRIAYRGR
jgi:glucose/arabinose dehydrogenase